MWSNFLAGTEDAESRGLPRRRRGGKSSGNRGRESALRLSLAMGLVALLLMATAAGTDHWAELRYTAPDSNQTCSTVRLGLWRQCQTATSISQAATADRQCPELETPAALFIVVAVLAVLCLCLMVLGSLSISMSLRHNPDFLIKLSASFFISAGLAAVATLLAFDQAVLGLQRTGLELSYLWSFGCTLAASILSSLAGTSFLIIALPGPALGLCNRGKASKPEA
ncbi:voltage-dependent calcium channel gamma-1 subunit-like [Hypanus sabinus]|uniref:voltage-dependent calcium channel gamma-1 subunit-like n=1 Tax=Hypanus sabinus TaxID=79690 RepID=UPI0028C38CD0|nr:voltage-dependent calcium channel gamma-1 subunit-like [Hypanus sabinus]